MPKIRHRRIYRNFLKSVTPCSGYSKICKSIKTQLLTFSQIECFLLMKKEENNKTDNLSKRKKGEEEKPTFLNFYFKTQKSI